MARVNVEATKYYKSGVAGLESGNYEKALEDLKTANVYAPNSEIVLAQLIIAARHNCDWLTVKKHETLIALASETIEKGALPGITPYYANTLTDNPKLQKIIAQIWAKELKKNTQQTTGPMSSGHAPRNTKCRVGYLSNNFNNHAVAHVAIDLFKNHNRQKFEIFGFSYSTPDSTTFSLKIKSSFENFFDISRLSDEIAIDLIKKQNLDILVDMVGYMAGARPRIAAARPAKALINFLGLTGTTGGISDYIIADKYLIPKILEEFYTEKVIRLPCYQPNSPRTSNSRKPKRKDHNLPENATVFSSFNRSYKITPEMWEVWMDILKRVPHGTLWLWADSRLAQKNLKEQALLKGVDPERVVFASTLPLDMHIARLNLADLALDTYPYNGGATTSNSLWAGVPVVSMYGKTYSSRMGLSLLSAAGLKGLAVNSLEDYKKTAIKFAKQKNLPAIAAKLQAGKLFDIKSYTKSLESEYEKIYKGTIK